MHGCPTCLLIEKTKVEKKRSILLRFRDAGFFLFVLAIVVVVRFISLSVYLSKLVHLVSLERILRRHHGYENWRMECRTQIGFRRDNSRWCMFISVDIHESGP